MNLIIDKGKLSDDQIAAFWKYHVLADKGDVDVTSFTAMEELGLTLQELRFIQKHHRTRCTNRRRTGLQWLATTPTD